MAALMNYLNSFFFRFSFLLFCLPLFVFDLLSFAFGILTKDIILKMYHRKSKTKDETFLKTNQTKKAAAVLGFHINCMAHVFEQIYMQSNHDLM